MRGPRASRRSARWEDCRRAGAAGTAPIAMIGLILAISLAGNSPQSHSAVARSENTVYATLAHPPVKRPAPADPSLATAQTSNGNDSNIIIEWSGVIIGSFTLLVTVLTLGTAVAALFGFSELRRARDRAAATQKQMADSLSEIEDLKSRWDSAVQEADTRVEAIVQSAYGFNQGQEAYAEGNYQRAADYFRRAHQLQPRSTAILYKLGRSYTNTGDVGKAESAFHTILEIEPTNAEAYRGLAIAHRYDDPAKALANARNAVDADPEDLKNWNCLGLMLRDDGKNAEAIEAHRRGHQLDEKQRITSFYLALLYAEAKRTAYAGDFIHQATVNLEDDQHYGRIKPLWAAVLNWAHAIFNSDEVTAAFWAKKAAAACQSSRRIHEVRGHMLFLLTALGHAGLIAQLPEALRSPVPHPPRGARYDHSSAPTDSHQGRSAISPSTNAEERQS